MARTRHVDKVIVTNVSELRRKYRGGYRRIAASVGALLTADRRRGLTTRFVALDDAATLKALGARAVTNPMEPEHNKTAVDGVYRALRPDYVLILGSVDVVPHQDLVNPMYDPRDDDDRIAWSDLPYACAAPYSTEPRDFVGPTRVVGRLPDLTGGDDPGYLVRLLEVAATYRTQAPDAYREYLGITADVWRKSSALTLRNLFGSAGELQVVPPKRPQWRLPRLAHRTHFINCHGAVSEPFFYGQKGRKYPAAHSAAYLEGKVTSGTVVAAECCYGAQLYDPTDARGQAGICNVYLTGGAYGFFGSSTTAYGSSAGSCYADSLCQVFLEQVMLGASLGRATLEARQRYLQRKTRLDAVDLKTIAQFHLLGDPAIHAVETAHPALTRTKAFHVAFPRAGNLPVGRSLRRERLFRNGEALGLTVGYFERAPAFHPPADVRRVLSLAVRESAIEGVRFASFDAHDPAPVLYRSEAPRKKTTRVHIAVGSRRLGPSKIARTTVLVATVEDGEIVGFTRAHAR